MVSGSALNRCGSALCHYSLLCVGYMCPFSYLVCYMSSFTAMYTLYTVQYATCLLSELSPAMCASCQLYLRQSYCYLSPVYIPFVSATCLLSLVMSATSVLSPNLCAMCLLIQSCVLHASFLYSQVRYMSPFSNLVCYVSPYPVMCATCLLSPRLSCRYLSPSSTPVM